VIGVSFGVTNSGGGWGKNPRCFKGRTTTGKGPSRVTSPGGYSGEWKREGTVKRGEGSNEKRGGVRVERKSGKSHDSPEA